MVISIQKALFQDIPQILSLHRIFLLFLDSNQIFLIKTFSIWRVKVVKLLMFLAQPVKMFEYISGIASIVKLYFNPKSEN